MVFSSAVFIDGSWGNGLNSTSAVLDDDPLEGPFKLMSFRWKQVSWR